MTDEIQIIEMKSEHAHDVAALHIAGIPTGFISSLGMEFVASLYKAIAKSDSSFGYVALKDNKVVGFASFSTNLNSLYKSVILESGLKFVFILAWKMLSFKTIKKVSETLFYPSRIEKLDLPSAEFLSMVVDHAARGKGLATRFIGTGFEEFKKRGIEKIKIFAAVDIVPINKLYKKLGFELATQMENHGIVSNVYVADVGTQMTI